MRALAARIPADHMPRRRVCLYLENFNHAVGSWSSTGRFFIRVETGSANGPVSTTPKVEIMNIKWTVLAFVAGAALSWGVYVPLVHDATTKFGSNLRAFLMVGIAYFLVAVLIPSFFIFYKGDPTAKDPAKLNWAHAEHHLRNSGRDCRSSRCIVRHFCREGGWADCCLHRGTVGVCRCPDHQYDRVCHDFCPRQEI